MWATQAQTWSSCHSESALANTLESKHTSELVAAEQTAHLQVSVGVVQGDQLWSCGAAVCVSLALLSRPICLFLDILSVSLPYLSGGDFFFFSIYILAVQYVRSYFPYQELNSHPLQWKFRVLTTGLPGKYLSDDFQYKQCHLFIGSNVILNFAGLAVLFVSSHINIRNFQLSFLSCTWISYMKISQHCFTRFFSL